jgi:Flp pilus assembly protein TadD
VLVGAAAVAAVTRRRPAGFALVLLILPLAPALHVGALNQGIGNAFTERYLYLPSAGFVLLVAWAFGRLARVGRAPTVAAVALVVVAYSVGTVRRVPVWENSLTLWTDAAARSPGSAIARMNHGFALLYDGQNEPGREELRAAARLDPEIYRFELDRGIAYARKGLLKKAILAFHAALTLEPACAPAHFNLGLAYEQRGQPDWAAQHYEQALAIDPAHAEAHNNLGILLAGSGRLDEARRHFEAAVRLQPEAPDFRANLEHARRLGANPR